MVQKNYSNIDILFQSKELAITDKKIKLLLLNLLDILLETMGTALHKFFILKDLSQFDSHVGENFCQVRASQILYLTNMFSEDSYSEKYFYSRIKNLEKIRESIKKAKLLIHNKVIIRRYQPEYIRQSLKNENLESFLQAENCLCDLQEHEVFLLYLYILSLYKTTDVHGEVKTDFLRLQKELNLSKTLAKKLIHRYQQKISEWTCDFIKQIVVVSPKLCHLGGILNKLERFDDDNRKMLPLFLTTEILIDNLINTDKSIIVVVERKIASMPLDYIAMLFKPNLNNTDFIFYSADINDIISTYDTPCFFISCSITYDSNSFIESAMNYIIRFNRIGLINIIMADAAVHPQYSGYKLGEFKVNPYVKLMKDDFMSKKSISIFQRFNERLVVAHRDGYGKFGNYISFIKHIFCDYPSHQLQPLANKEKLFGENV